MTDAERKALQELLKYKKEQLKDLEKDLEGRKSMIKSIELSIAQMEDELAE